MCVRLTDLMKLSYSFKPYCQNQEKNFAEIKRATAHNEMNGRQARYLINCVTNNVYVSQCSSKILSSYSNRKLLATISGHTLRKHFEH